MSIHEALAGYRNISPVVTLNDLIAQLEEIRQREGGYIGVLVDGYEYGYTFVRELQLVDVGVYPEHGDDSFGGEFDDACERQPAVLRAVLLPRWS